MGIVRTRLFKRVEQVLSLALSASLIAMPVALADPSTLNVPVTPGSTPAQLPSSFTTLNPSAAQGMFSNMSCVGGVSSYANYASAAANGLATASAAGAGPFGALTSVVSSVASQAAGCPGSEDVGGGGSSGGGSGNCIGAAAGALITGMMIDKVIGNIQCKLSGLASAASELNCIMSYARQLQTQVGNMQNLFVNNLQRYQRDVSSLKQSLVDRKNQQQFVDVLLNGDKDDAPITGGDSSKNGGVVKTHNDGSPTRPGLNNLRKQFMGWLVGGDTANNDTGAASSPNDTSPKAPNAGTLPGAIVTLQNQVKTLTAEKQRLEDDVQADETAGAVDCFNNTTNGAFRCTPDGPPVSAKDYMICRYQQNQQLGSNGVISTSQTSQSQAKAAAQGLQAVLDDLNSQRSQTLEKPSQIVSGTDPNSAQQSVDNSDKQTSPYKTPADIIAAYKAQIAPFNGKGLDLASFFTKRMTYCDQVSKARVTALRTRSGSRYEVRQRGLQENETAIRAMIDTTTNKSAKLYADGVRALVGQNVPIDTSACRNAVLDTKVNCLNDMEKQLNNLLDGTGPNSAMNVQVKGTSLAPPIGFTCNGINGCATSLNNLNDNIKAEVTRVDSFKTQYVQAANQSIVQFVMQAGQQLAPASAYVNDQLTALNAKLSTLGAKRINVKSMEPEQLQTDSSLDGLYRIPNNAINVIGGKGKMNPPLPDLEDQGLQQSLDGIAERQKELNQKLGQAQQAKIQGMMAVANCKMEGMDQADKQAGNTSQNIATNDCATEQFCNANADALNNIANNPGNNKDTGGLSNLSGVAQDCQNGNYSTGQKSVSACNMASRQLKSISTNVSKNNDSGFGGLGQSANDSANN